MVLKMVIQYPGLFVLEYAERVHVNIVLLLLRRWLEMCCVDHSAAYEIAYLFN